MRPWRDEILRWAYRRMVTAARSRDATPVFILLRMTDRDFDPQELDKLTRIAGEAGALVLHPVGLFEDHPPEQVRLSSGDTHPSVLGHRLIADAVYGALVDHASELGISTPSEPRVAPISGTRRTD
jgi:hypothetical protein